MDKDQEYLETCKNLDSDENFEETSLLPFVVTEEASQFVWSLLTSEITTRRVRVSLEGFDDVGLAWTLLPEEEDMESSREDASILVSGLTFVIDRALLAALGGALVGFEENSEGGSIFVVPMAPGLADFRTSCGGGCGHDCACCCSCHSHEGSCCHHEGDDAYCQYHGCDSFEDSCCIPKAECYRVDCDDHETPSEG